MQTKLRHHWQKTHLYRFEFLIFTLSMVLFNKIFFTDQDFYVQFIWPSNMIVLGIASIAIFKEENIKILKWSKNILFLGSVLVPFFSAYIFKNYTLSVFSMIVYILYYVIIFVEVLRQITRKGEITMSVILGALCGYLLMIIISIFSFILVEFFVPGSFSNTNPENIPDFYNQISYFSMVTIATIGYGDVTPISESARLMAAFFGILGQFYMVTLVGILISKFT